MQFSLVSFFWSCHGSGSLLSGLPPRRTGIQHRQLCVRFVVDKVAAGQAFLRVLRLITVGLVSQICFTLRTSYFSEDKRGKTGDLQKELLVRKLGSIEEEIFSIFSSFIGLAHCRRYVV
jgi:hypothetical protein